MDRFVLSLDFLLIKVGFLITKNGLSINVKATGLVVMKFSGIILGAILHKFFVL
jgi:hypothetical protein